MGREKNGHVMNLGGAVTRTSSLSLGSSVAVMEHFKTNIEKLTQEKEHYYHENE